MAHAGDVAPTVLELLAAYETLALAPPKGAARRAARMAFHAARNRGWLALRQTFDSHRTPINKWVLNDAGRIALAAWRAQRERDAA